MKIGDLRHRVEIQYAAPTVGATGSVTETWATLDTVYAKLSPLSGTERLIASQRQEVLTHVMVTRHRFNFGDLTYVDLSDWHYVDGTLVTAISLNEPIAPKHRAVYYGRTFEIVEVLDNDERHRYDTLTLRELR